MKIIFLFVVIFISSLSAQQEIPDSKIHSPESIKAFADWLFCSGDFLRASLEYEKNKEVYYNDTIKFKLAMAYSEIEKKDKARILLESIGDSSLFYTQSRNEIMKNLFLTSEWKLLEQHRTITADSSTAKMFLYIASLSQGNFSFNENEFVNIFPEKNKTDMKIFFDRKKEPGYKSPLLASCLSVLVPGSGKFYTNHWGDGITAFVTTGLLTFLSVNNFKADHQFRGWLFAGLGFFFYAGNVYGSAASAYIYNEDVDREFENDYRNYINKENYFIPKIEFCK